MMNKILFLMVSLFVLISCNQKENKISIVKNDTTSLESSTINENWLESFNDFRNALYQNDKTKLKPFFTFPVIDENNEIWYLVEDEHQLSFLGGKAKPFTEKDFDSYYFKIFNQHFVKGLLKIKAKELYNKGEYETIMLSGGADLSYKIFATFDKKANQIILNFYTEENYEITNGEYEKSEFSRIYYFDISNNKLQFNKVRLAG